MVSVLYHLMLAVILAGGIGNRIQSEGYESNETESSGMYNNSKDEDAVAALAEFRDLVDHLTYREFMKSDAYLIRWLREANFDVYEAYDKLSKFINWRRERNVDSIVFKDFSNIDKEHPYVIDRVDKDGRPVIYIPFGTYNIRKIAITGAEERYQTFMIRMYELCEIYLQELRSKPQSSNVTKLVAIYDLAGFNLKTGACFQCVSMIPELVSNFNSNYPGIFFKAFLINTPKIFLKALDIGGNFMSIKTRQTLNVYGYEKSEWIPALLAQIPTHQLPTEFGGTQPSFHSKSVREAQHSFLADLLRKARESVQKDLSDNEKNELDMDMDDIDTAHDIFQRNQTNTKHRHHHHHSSTHKAQNPNPNTSRTPRTWSSFTSSSSSNLATMQFQLQSTVIVIQFSLVTLLCMV